MYVAIILCGLLLFFNGTAFGTINQPIPQIPKEEDPQDTAIIKREGEVGIEVVVKLKDDEEDPEDPDDDDEEDPEDPDDDDDDEDPEDPGRRR